MAKKKIEPIVEKKEMNRTEFIHIISVKTEEFLDVWKTAMRNSPSKSEVVQLRREFSGLKADYMRSFSDDEAAAEILVSMDNMIVELKSMVGGV